MKEYCESLEEEVKSAKGLSNTMDIARTIAGKLNLMAMKNRGKKPTYYAKLATVKTRIGLYRSMKTPIILIIGVNDLSEICIPKGWQISRVKGAVSDGVKINLLSKKRDHVEEAVPIACLASIDYLPEFKL